MNFTREPILETIIAAKEGFKLRLKSTKHAEAQEYLVDAVEVVSFGTTFFYRSGEPAHTFFVPSQDFEIVQVRQARLMLKTPTDKAVKIAGGAEASKKPGSEKPKKKQRSSKEKDVVADKPKNEEKTETVAKEEVKTAEQTDKKPAKGRNTKKAGERKTTTRAKKRVSETEAIDQPVQASMFSHLLRPPEALISDNIKKYQDMMEAKPEEKKDKMVNVTESTPEINSQEAEGKDSSKNVQDDPNLTSEAPKPFEKLTEETDTPEIKESVKPLASLKEKMKKVLAPALKDPVKAEESSEE